MDITPDKRRWPLASGGESTIAFVSLVLIFIIALHRRQRTMVTRVLAVLGTCVALLILYFFRDPERTPIEEPGLVVSAADGEVVEIQREVETTYLNREMTRISVFLSIFDVHVQRVPISGKVLQVTHKPGRFLQAFRPEASTLNEHIAMVLETKYGPVLVKQIAGILARRCVNNVNPGDLLHSGQRYGMIKFGSRVDLYLPVQAEILVTVGDKVSGGLTAVARLPRLKEPVLEEQ